MTVEIQSKKPSVDDYCRLRAGAGWPVPERAYCQAALDGCLFGFVAVDDQTGEVVGMVRAVGDGVLINYIQDLIVSPGWRGKGIARQLMQAAMDKLGEMAMPKSNVALIAAPNAEPFYEKFGFVRFKEDVPGMRRQI